VCTSGNCLVAVFRHKSTIYTYCRPLCSQGTSIPHDHLTQAHASQSASPAQNVGLSLPKSSHRNAAVSKLQSNSDIALHESENPLPITTPASPSAYARTHVGRSEEGTLGEMTNSFVNYRCGTRCSIVEPWEIGRSWCFSLLSAVVGSSAEATTVVPAPTFLARFLIDF
jgi:hypothetical protein